MSQKNDQNLASCSFVKHRLILIILGKQSILDDTTACQSWLVFTRHSLVRAKGEVLVLLFFCSFFVNDFWTTRGPIHAKFCMRAYSGSGCVFSPFGGSGPGGGGGKGGNGIFVKNLCRMRMAGLFLHFFET